MVRGGRYRVVRHASYLGLLMVFAAIGIHSRNWVGFVVAVVPTTAALMYRTQVEEQALQEAFGEEYAPYSRVTKRLVPGVY
jgi:protein-S-isoprenylcysteine O-methyltransferase Ste14